MSHRDPGAAWTWLPPGSEAWEVWDDVARGADVGATSSRAWTSAWSRHYGDVAPHRIGVAWADGVPYGAVLVAAVQRRRGGLPVRCLQVGTGGEPAGTGVEAPYGRMLVGGARRSAFAGALDAALRREHGWDLLRLERLHPDDATALIGQRPGWRVTVEPSPTTDLRPCLDGADVLGLLPARTRQQLRRALREHGPVAVDVAADVPEAHEVLADLVDLHQARFRPGSFADPRFLAFHRELVDELVPDGRLLLLRVRGADRTLGCVAVLRDGDRALSYTGGIADPRGRHDKPGFLVHVEAMRACAAHGMSAYDLLTGGSPYKRELCGSVAEQVTLERERRGSPRILAGSAARRIRDARPARTLAGSAAR